MRAISVLVTASILLAGGCRSAPPLVRPTTQQLISNGLTVSSYVDAIQADCVPPAGWIAEPLKESARHKHQIWLSPTGHTAYGIIHFDLPLPVGTELVLLGFLNEMRRTEGTATLVEKKWDANLNGLRFVAEGGHYKVRTNLVVRGFSGWAVYAGTLQGNAIEPDELILAERARDHTAVGVPTKSMDNQ